MLGLLCKKDYNGNRKWRRRSKKDGYIEMKNSSKRYQTGDTEIIANKDVSFEIEKGELVIILGASGAGKSTVLNILGGMDTNDEARSLLMGSTLLNSILISAPNYRRDDVGFVSNSIT